MLWHGGIIRLRKRTLRIIDEDWRIGFIPAVRNHTEDGIIAAPGTSCRHQVKDGTGKRLNTLWKFYTKHFYKVNRRCK